MSCAMLCNCACCRWTTRTSDNGCVTQWRVNQNKQQRSELMKMVRRKSKSKKWIQDHPNAKRAKQSDKSLERLVWVERWDIMSHSTRTAIGQGTGERRQWAVARGSSRLSKQPKAENTSRKSLVFVLISQFNRTRIDKESKTTKHPGPVRNWREWERTQYAWVFNRW